MSEPLELSEVERLAQRRRVAAAARQCLRRVDASIAAGRAPAWGDVSQIMHYLLDADDAAILERLAGRSSS